MTITNIYNPQTGETGYQVPGAPIASGWLAGTPGAAPVATTAPSGQTSTSQPASTAVVSSGAATSDVNNISKEVTNASNDITNQANYLGSQTPPPPPPPAPPQPKPTPEEQIANSPAPGNQFVYDTTTGARSEVPVGSPLQPGQTMTDVTNAAAQDTVQTGTSTIKQFGDGTYGIYDASGKYVGPANAKNFNDAKGAQKAISDLAAIQNGTYPLTAGQQSQLDAVTQYYNQLIEAQKIENANVTGNVTGLQNLFGVGGSSVAISAINKSIADGAAKIAEINRRMVDAVNSLRSAIQADNINVVKSLYAQYKDSVDDKQKEMDRIQAQVVDEKQKMDQRNSDIAVAMAKKYPDTEDPILPSDTPAEVAEKLKTSLTYQQNTAIQATLTPDENSYFADMLTSGFNMNKVLPNLGYGKAGTAAKIAVIKPMIEKAMNAGLTGAEFGAAMVDKTAKAAAYNKLQTQGSQLAAQESKVEADFNLVKQAGAKVPDKILQSGVPFLQNWINTGVLQSSGNPELNNYLGLLTTSLTNYARVVAGQTGTAATTAQMNTEIQSIINKGLSISAVNSYIDNAAIPEMKNTIKGYDSVMKDIMSGLNVADGTTNAVGGMYTPGAENTSSGSASSGKVETNPDGTLKAVSF